MSVLERNPHIVTADYQGPRTILFIPSIHLGSFTLRFFHGVQYYEERYLYFLTFLKNPSTRLITVLSRGVEPSAIEYFCDHASRAIGLSRTDLKKRWTLIFAPPAHGEHTLTRNILQSPSLIKEIQASIPKKIPAFIEFWRVIPDEVRLARALHLPYYGLAPRAMFINTKSGARTLFHRSGRAIPRGYEHLHTLQDVHRAIQKLSRMSSAESFLIKMNDEGSGMGIVKVSRKQCLLSFSQFLKSLALPPDQPLSLYQKYFRKNGGVVEEFIDAALSISPSVQFEIMPKGTVRNLATHEQILQGTDYLGTQFPAPVSYRAQIIRAGTRVAREIAHVGGRGFIAMDFLVTKDRKNTPWKVWGIEINARKGGTNHTHLWAKYLTGAHYNHRRGILESSRGDVYYRASEQFLNAEWLKQVAPEKLLETIRRAGLDFDHEKKRGVFVHLLSPLRHYGKFGVTVIGHTEREVARFWNRLMRVVRGLQ